MAILFFTTPMTFSHVESLRHGYKISVKNTIITFFRYELHIFILILQTNGTTETNSIRRLAAVVMPSHSQLQV